MKCPNCKEWETEIEKVNAPIINQAIRMGVDFYDGKPFVYCPWCGTQLEGDEPPEPAFSTPFGAAIASPIEAN